MFFFFRVGAAGEAGAEEQRRAVHSLQPAADLVEYEKVLKLFFVPVWRWPGKESVMRCNNCNLFFPHSLSPPPEKEALEADLRCQFCSRPVDPSFRFCLFCGSAI